LDAATAHRTPRVVQLHDAGGASARAELLAGLAATPATIAPKFFYDAVGSRLFAAITELDEYYPTRTEAAIFATHLVAMARAFGVERATLIDLGAGNCEKAARLFDAFGPERYVAVDISAAFLLEALHCLQRQFPRMDLLGVGADFSSQLQLPPELPRERRLVFYPGSSIGNFTPERALRFLLQVRDELETEGGLLIGVDLVKDTATLEAAYDDALGVTAAFNLNVLLHANRLAGTDFRLSDWRHIARFAARESRIEMHLAARRPVTVRYQDFERCFAEGETIHTENSYKYTVENFSALLQRAGFIATQVWTDSKRWFGVFLAKPG